MQNFGGQKVSKSVSPSGVEHNSSHAERPFLMTCRNQCRLRALSTTAKHLPDYISFVSKSVSPSGVEHMDVEAVRMAILSVEISVAFGR